MRRLDDIFCFEDLIPKFRPSYQEVTSPYFCDHLLLGYGQEEGNLRGEGGENWAKPCAK